MLRLAGSSMPAFARSKAPATSTNPAVADGGSSAEDTARSVRHVLLRGSQANRIHAVLLAQLSAVGKCTGLGLGTEIVAAVQPLLAHRLLGVRSTALRVLSLHAPTLPRTARIVLAWSILPLVIDPAQPTAARQAAQQALEIIANDDAPLTPARSSPSLGGAPEDALLKVEWGRAVAARRVWVRLADAAWQFARLRLVCHLS